MDSRLESVLREFELQGAAEEQAAAAMTPEEYARRREEFLVHIGRETASLIHLLIQASKTRRILELGTCFGYSTLWLADAARRIGGSVVTCEIQSSKLERARATVAKCGLSDYVDFRLGDAVSILRDLEGPFDFVLLDLWKDCYVPALEAFHPKLSDGALVIADNMLHPVHYHALTSAYRASVRSKGDMESLLLGVGKGLEVSRQTKAPSPELAFDPNYSAVRSETPLSTL